MIYLAERIQLLKRNFDDVLSRWGEVLELAPNDLVRDAAILRFELSFEVTWKLLQLLVREQGFEANSPRQAFQQAFTIGWIRDEQVWADILRSRNTAVHVYRQEYAEALYNELPRYYLAFQELQTALRAEI